MATGNMRVDKKVIMTLDATVINVIYCIKLWFA